MWGGKYYYKGKQENINYIFEHDIFQYEHLSFENYMEFNTGDYYPFSEEAVCDFTIKGSCLKQYEKEIDALFSNCPYLYAVLTGKNTEDNKISFFITRRIVFPHHIGRGIALTNTGFSDGKHGSKIRKAVYTFQMFVWHAILVQMIFGKLLKKNQVVDSLQVGYNKLIGQKGEKNIYVYFDVMNNNTELKKLHYLHHSIENYVIYPKMYGHPSLQNIHKYYGERWDDFLRFLKANWESETIVYITKQAEECKYEQPKSFKHKWSNVSFKKYMKMTCQYMYYEKVYEDLIRNKEMCDTEAGVQVLMDTYDNWDLSNGELITIKAVQDMKFLIEVREKMIMLKIKM